MSRWTHEKLTRFAIEALSAMGSPEEHARIVAEHLVGCNLSGLDSHGVLRLIQYHTHVKEGKIDPAATPELIREGPTTALLDGNRAWGQVVAHRLTELAIEKVRKQGVAAVAARHVYHIGRVGVYPALAASEGFLAELFCNVHGAARVAPWGGTEARLATNPVALAAPRRGAPLLADITTSVVPEGKVRLMKVSGQPIPEGWVLDSAGNPTTDPADLYEGGTLLPFGSREGHKGYGLGVMVDLFGGILTGAGAGLMNDSLGNGLFMQLADPEAFETRDAFLDRVEEYIAYLKSSAKKPGVDEILLPGEPELRREAELRETGIELDEGSLSQLADLAAELGIGALKSD